MAQIMYFHKYPSTYPWTSMYTSWSSGTPPNYYIADLMIDVGNSVDMEYHDIPGSYPHNTGWPWYISVSPGWALQNVFGYTSAAAGAFNYSTVMSNLDYNMPVILDADNGTSGHSWVCDGYTTWTYQYCDPVMGGTYLFFHMNWGWGNHNNENNGNYGADVWTVSNSSTTLYLQYNHHMTYNIHP
jgi:hypothetical protein